MWWKFTIDHDDLKLAVAALVSALAISLALICRAATRLGVEVRCTSLRGVVPLRIEQDWAAISGG